MTPPEIDEKARELIQCLGIWGINNGDALSIAKAMVLILRDEPRDQILDNPLAGLTNVAPGLPGGDKIN